ncbi:hypothetical protein ACJW30_03G038700 [Castanea mollissima]
MLRNIINRFKALIDTDENGKKKIEGTVVLMKKNVLDFNDFNASVLDDFHELLGQKVSFQLISAVNGDPANELQGKLGRPAYLENWITTITSLTSGVSAFKVTFDWDNEIGVPGAFLIKNNHHNVPGQGRVHFVCISWVYPADKYRKDCVFFSNKTYLPSETPVPLLKLREKELVDLRGDGTGELQEWDRVYDYAYYNDLGDSDKNAKYARLVLGGSSEYPYPRRGRTGRPPTKTDPSSESKMKLLMSLNIYVSRDERFGHLKLSDFLAYALKSVGQFLKPELESLFDSTPNEFDSLQDVLKLYEGGIKLPEGAVKNIRDNIPAEMLKEVFPTDGEGLLKYPMPQVIKEDRSAWRTDEEFTREMLAGVNPVNIGRLKLDPKVYGDQNSTIAKEHIENNIDGLTTEEAIKKNKLFILDHHDAFMPYLRRINSTSTKTYASRTLLFLKNDGALKPLVIELSLPHPKGDQFGAISKVYIPAEQGIEGSIWQLAKAYVAVNDSGYHQLISHWLITHSVIEPFVIAANRQLSVLHPIYKLLHPHFHDTMNINAFAQQILINGGGLLELTVFPAKYSMEMSSVVYKDWVFPEQALPADLIKRMVEAKFKTPNFGNLIGKDAELQSCWKELREKGHGDKKDELWCPKMQTHEELVETCTIIIWIASALHAAVNFGQYPYAGYLPNRPTISRRFMPEVGTPEYEELKLDLDKDYLKTITAQLPTLIGISLIEILSRHSSDEVYLGQRDTPEWTFDTKPLEAFERFGKKLAEIEDRIMTMNNDNKWENQVGPVKVPFTLLYPTSEGGLTGMGIPNSCFSVIFLDSLCYA